MARGFMLGHNRPAEDVDPLRQRLDVTHAWILEQAYAIQNEESLVPATVTADNIWRASNYVRMARNCVKDADEAHKVEKEEFLAACRTCDEWANSIKGPLLEAIARTEERIGIHLKAKEAAERERLEAEGNTEEARRLKPADLVRTITSRGTVTLKAPWTGVIEDITQLDLEKLRPYLSFDALDRAVRAFARNGGRELKGARIYQDRKVLVT
jgi:hypothetical protein